jgi:hypothetical protein
MYSPYSGWRVPFRIDNSTLFRSPALLELRVQPHEQRDVWHPIRTIAGAIPHQKSWDG